MPLFGLYAVMRNLDAIIRVSNYVRLYPGLQRARPLWSGASDKLIMPILPAQRKFMLLSMAKVHLEQLASPNLDSDSQGSVFDLVETLYNTLRAFDIMLWLNDRHLVKVFYTLNDWQSHI